MLLDMTVAYLIMGQRCVSQGLWWLLVHPVRWLCALRIAGCVPATPVTARAAPTPVTVGGLSSDANKLDV